METLVSSYPTGDIDLTRSVQIDLFGSDPCSIGADRQGEVKEMNGGDESHSFGLDWLFNQDDNSDVDAASIWPAVVNLHNDSVNSGEELVDPAVLNTPAKLLRYKAKAMRMPLSEDVKTELLEADAICAKTALKLYNEMVESGEGCELELVDALISNPFMFKGIWYHLNFIAKPKGGHADQERIYFAELKHLSEFEDELTKFCEVELKGRSNAKNFGGCRACSISYVICHPPDGGFLGARRRRRVQAVSAPAAPSVVPSTTTVY